MMRIMFVFVISILWTFSSFAISTSKVSELSGLSLSLTLRLNQTGTFININQANEMRDLLVRAHNILERKDEHFVEYNETNLQINEYVIIQIGSSWAEGKVLNFPGEGLIECETYSLISNIYKLSRFQVAKSVESYKGLRVGQEVTLNPTYRLKKATKVTVLAVFENGMIKVKYRADDAQRENLTKIAGIDSYVK